MVRCVLCDYSKRNSHDSTGSNHGKATGNDEVASWAGKSINSMRLSGKELQIIANYARGFTTSTIAHQLNISEAR